MYIKIIYFIQNTFKYDTKFLELELVQDIIVLLEIIIYNYINCYLIMK